MNNTFSEKQIKGYLDEAGTACPVCGSYKTTEANKIAGIEAGIHVRLLIECITCKSKWVEEHRLATIIKYNS
jgi:formate dehydrogenase maturation protein FdhE